MMGLVIGLVAGWIGRAYYKKRFGTCMDHSGLRLLLLGEFGILSDLLLAISGCLLIQRTERIFLISMLFILAWIDARHGVLPNGLLLILFVFRVMVLGLAVSFTGAGALSERRESVLGILYGVGALLPVRLMRRQGIGMGDIKLFAVIGFYVGNYRILPVLLISLVIGLVSILTGLARKKISLRDSVSFGPYIAASGTLFLMLGV